MSGKPEVLVIGGGLAGCEAAYQVAKRGGRAVVYEMKPVRFSPAHSMDTLAELVCSNSLKSEDTENASGLLKEEMRLLDSLILKAAHSTRVPAGKSLAVDRTGFSRFVTDALQGMGVKVVREEVTSIPEGRPVVIATGPLTSKALATEVQALVGRESLYFYDAVSPIVFRNSIDMEKAYLASRYGKGSADFINCPLDEEEYRGFLKELLSADRAGSHFDERIPYFEGCMPIEVLAERGEKTLAFGPMKPVGLPDPRTGKTPYAVVQLRKETREGTLYNIVGFQTRLTFGAQKKVFSLIPGLERAEFARLGKLHRNTYINSPGVLTPAQQLKKDPAIFFAGQITGVEGYLESAVSGLLAGINALRVVSGNNPVSPPPTTMTGALLSFISTPNPGFQPMNANFGLLPGRAGKKSKAKRALADLLAWKNEFLEN